MSEAEVLYCDVMFTREHTRETASSMTTYSEVKISKIQPSAEQPAASQQVQSNRQSKVTSERVSLLVLSVLLMAAVIGLGVVLVSNLKTKEELQTLQNMYKNLTDERCQKCEEGWEQHGGKCYYFSIISSSWNQSREECRLQGGDLVKIDSREEQSFLENRLREKMNEPEDKFWIGLTDSEEEGRWLWVDGSALSTSLTFWSHNEPSNYNGENPDGEDCARMGEKYEAVDLKCWYDRSCNAHQRRICEKSAGSGL